MELYIYIKFSKKILFYYFIDLCHILNRSNLKLFFFINYIVYCVNENRRILVNYLVNKHISPQLSQQIKYSIDTLPVHLLSVDDNKLMFVCSSERSI